MNNDKELEKELKTFLKIFPTSLQKELNHASNWSFVGVENAKRIK